MVFNAIHVVEHGKNVYKILPAKIEFKTIPFVSLHVLNNIFQFFVSKISITLSYQLKIFDFQIYGLYLYSKFFNVINVV